MKPKNPSSEDEGSPLIAASQWRQIVNSATDTAIISTDPDGRITSWSSGATHIFGWNEHEMLDQTLDRLFTEEDRQRDLLATEMVDAITRGRGGGDEGWRLRKDGSRIWATGEITPILAGTRVLGFTKILRDRTLQRRAEDDLREEQNTLAILNRAGSALALENDLQRLVQIVTDAGVELTGAEFGAFFYNVLDEAGESYMLYTLSGAPIEAFSKFPMPRNTQIFAPTFNGEGIVRSDDITKDPRYGNNAPRRGMPEGHLPVRSYLAVPVISRSGEVIGGLFFGHARTAVFTDRSEVGLSGLAAEAAVAIDNARLTQAMQREITERRRAQDALHEMNMTLERQVAERTEELRSKEQALRQSQKMEAVGQLTGGIAHDFNNLLMAVLGSLDIVRRRMVDEPRLKILIDNAIKGAQRGVTLTQRMLAFARRQDLQIKPVHVPSLVQGMTELMQRSLGSSVLMRVEIEDDLPKVLTDENQLELAILNLAMNARDAMPTGGTITISATECEVLGFSDKRFVCLSVSDTGEGMDEETLAKAMEPFFTTKGVGKGTGLGLSMVHGVAEQSGGRLELKSKVGEGTTAELLLPISKDQSDHDTVAVAKKPSAKTKRLTVLAVDDDPLVLVNTVAMLEDLGHRVFAANSGMDALKIFDAEKVRLVITDQAMPLMTGTQLSEALRAKVAKLPIVLATGYAELDNVEISRLHRLSKPFTQDDLARAIEAVTRA